MPRGPAAPRGPRAARCRGRRRGRARAAAGRRRAAVRPRGRTRRGRGPAPRPRARGRRRRREARRSAYCPPCRPPGRASPCARADGGAYCDRRPCGLTTAAPRRSSPMPTSVVPGSGSVADGAGPAAGHRRCRRTSSPRDGDVEPFSRDATPLFRARPDAVVLPPRPQRWPTVLRLGDRDRGTRSCRAGGGSNLAAATVPERGGIVLVLTRMTAVKEVSAEELLAVVETGRDDRRRSRTRRPRARACSTRPTPAAARSRPSAATSRPAPAACAA